jgi:hypothetical protein
MHIELTEMLRCPEPHREEFLVLSTGEMSGRMVQSGLVGCPVCHKEYEVVNGTVDFGAGAPHPLAPAATPGSAALAGAVLPAPDAPTLQALLDLGGPGGIVVLLGNAARQAEGLAGLMSGIHFVAINPPPDVEELPVMSVLHCGGSVPLRGSVARGVVIGADHIGEPWLTEGHRVLLRGRRYVLESESVELPPGISRLAAGDGVIVGEKR